MARIFFLLGAKHLECNIATRILTKHDYAAHKLRKGRTLILKKAIHSRKRRTLASLIQRNVNYSSRQNARLTQRKRDSRKKMNSDDIEEEM
ncbi:hypothetical protein QL285_064381 [Trifolium repens]|nr:hypothetical protein QL285_064381 [Trifolium repens]